MVERELRTLKMMHEETKKYPDFYSRNRVKLLVSLFDHIDVDNSGTLTFEEVCPCLSFLYIFFCLLMRMSLSGVSSLKSGG